MFQIKKTLELNKKSFNHIKGRKFYYSPQIKWLTLFLNISFVLLILYGCILLGFKDGLWNFGALLLMIYSILNMIHKVIFKNPIFILNENMLYYTKNEQWYDLTKVVVYERYAQKFNFSYTLTIEDELRERLVSENFWYVEYDDELKKLIRKYYNK